MPIDVTVVLQAASAIPAVVGAVGSASLGVRALIKGFRAARESGLSHGDSFTRARSAEYEAKYRSQGGFGSSMPSMSDSESASWRAGSTDKLK